MLSNSCSIIVEDLKPPRDKILTGIGFLDHMIDQLNSHAQIGVSISVGDTEAYAGDECRNRNRSSVDGVDQGELMFFVGGKIGAELRRLVTQSARPVGSSSSFACPLDEALVECQITIVSGSGQLSHFTLPPYGSYPITGRKHIGSLETDKLERFFAGLAQEAHLDVSLGKVRGHNAHHIVESAFKALSRALRNLLDGVSCNAGSDALAKLYGPDSENHRAGVNQVRQGTLSRSTKETSITVSLKLDGGAAGTSVSTGIQTLDRFFVALAQHASLSLHLSCHGDLHIDEHHTAEDVAIALGQCLSTALGTKAGLNRMWCATKQHGSASVQVVMDLSNRPCLTHNVSLASSGAEKVGDLSLEMWEHALESLVANARMTVHIVELAPGGDLLDLVLATAMAFGEAFRFCSMVDLRRCGATASSKGTLSV